MDTKFKTTANLNVRTGPGTQHSRIKTLPAGTVVEDIPVSGWCQVGPDQWVSRDYLKAVDNPETPVVEQPEPVVIYENQLAAMFGQPRDPASYLKLMDFSEFKPALSHVMDYLGNSWGFRIWGHYLLQVPLRQAFQNLVDRGHGQEFKTYYGCLNIRPKTSWGSFSTHAWGLAVDINAERNWYGQKPTLSAGFVKCFTDAGFTWGGFWRGRGGQNDYSGCDGMHFQIPKV